MTDQTKRIKPIVPGTPEDCVCRECQTRQVGCHSSCRAYLAFARANREKREKNLRLLEENTDVVLARFRRALRSKPTRGR